MRTLMTRWSTLLANVVLTACASDVSEPEIGELSVQAKNISTVCDKDWSKTLTHANICLGKELCKKRLEPGLFSRRKDTKKCLAQAICTDQFLGAVCFDDFVALSDECKKITFTGGECTYPFLGDKTFTQDCLAYGQGLSEQMKDYSAKEFEAKCPQVPTHLRGASKEMQKLCPTFSLAYSMKNYSTESHVVKLFNDVCPRLGAKSIAFLPVKTIQAGDEIMQVAFSRDSRFFSAQFQRKDLVKVWKTETLQFQSEIDSNRGFSGVLWTPGRELIVGGNGGSVFRSSVSVNDTKEEIFKLPSGFGAKWFTLSPDGSKLMLQSASKPWPIFVQNLSDNTFIQFNPPTLSSNAGIFHPDGETLVLFGTNLQPRSSGGDRQDGLVELWSISGSGVTFSRRIILKEEVTSVAVHPNGEMLAIGLNKSSLLSSSKEEPAIELWNIKKENTPVCFKKLGLHKNSVAGLAFTPDGRFLFSAGDINGTLLAKEEEKYDRLGVWSMADISASRNTCENPIIKPRESFNCKQYGGCNRIAISHDGSRWLFSKGREGRLALEIIFYR